MKKLLYLSLLLLIFSACRKDNEEITIIETEYNPPVIEVTGTVVGTVSDENDQPVAGAAVTSWDGSQTQTDEDGVFVLKNIKLNQNGTYLRVEKPGYFHNSTLFYPGNNSVNYLKFKMISNDASGSFTASEGGEVALSSGATVDIAPNSVVNSNGQSFSGNVNVAITWLDPTADDLGLRMPGGLLGFTEDGLVRSLESYGMIGVELRDDNGNLLNLGNGGTADLSFPIPAELAANAPGEIPLWHFDEVEGIWKEEGKAVRQGDQYVGQVSHFSFWNCDAPFPLITLKGTVLTPDGNPLVNIGIKIIRSTTGGRTNGYGRTNDTGVFCGKVPKDEVLTIQIVDECGNAYYDEQIGPFSTDTDLGNITVNNISTDLYTFTGTAEDCNNMPLTEGIFKLRVGTQSFAFLVKDGTLDYSAVICNSQDATYYVVNTIDLEESDKQTINLTTNNIDLGNIVACGNQVTEYLIVTLDGVSKTYLSNLLAFGGNSTGSAGVNFQISDSLQSSFVFFGVSDTLVGTYDAANNFLEGINDVALGPNGINRTNVFNFEQVEITAYGAVGELIQGTFEHTNFEYFDKDNNLVTGATITGSFSIPRIR